MEFEDENRTLSAPKRPGENRSSDGNLAFDSSSAEGTESRISVMLAAHGKAHRNDLSAA